MGDKPSSSSLNGQAPLHLPRDLTQRQTIQAIGATLFLFFFFLQLNSHSRTDPPRGSSNNNNDVASRLAEPGTAYEGEPWHNERTVAVETLGETKFARCDVHTVLSEDGKDVIDDWIFLEETPAVNVIVRDAEGRFVVFDQRKYAIPGETLSPVGGFVDAGESPLTAAKREVLEELGLGSRRTLRTVREVQREVNKGLGGYSNNNNGIVDNFRDGGPPKRTPLDVAAVSDIIRSKAPPPAFDEHGLPDGAARRVPLTEPDVDWVFLGRYRTAANRGGGFLYSYLLNNAVPLVPGGGTLNFAGTGDGEAQEILYLGEGEVMQALGEGRFKEVKWAATFALAMLHLNDGMAECCGSKN